MLARLGSQDDRLKLILTVIAENADQSATIPLGSVARKLGMSVSTVQRALRAGRLDFRNAVSLMRLVNAERLLLEEPTLKVEALSLLAGWRSRRSLYLAVQRIRGCSLAQWRDRLLKGPVPDAPVPIPVGTFLEARVFGPRERDDVTQTASDHEPEVVQAEAYLYRARVGLLVPFWRSSK